jgi:maltose alpha-D-glucosyltransferase/alpha-amylase
MLRSFSYAAYSALELAVQTNLDAQPALEPWVRLWQDAACTAFLNAYKRTAAADPNLLPQPRQAQALLNAYLLEKALYELLYELNNRPSWVRIPLAGILALKEDA